MKKIGILGGTFDPIHIAHLIAVDQVLFYEKLDEIWFMPAPIPPHKIEIEITPIEHRVQMVKKAIEIDQRYKLCTIELEQSGPAYTIHTIKELKKRYPEHDFFFIIGGDMIEYLPKWNGIGELIKLVRFIGLERPGYQLHPKTAFEKEIYHQVKILPMPQLEISSSHIRDWVKMGRMIRYVVPSSVEDYIKENKLYEA